MGTTEETVTVRFCDICHSTTSNTGTLDTCHVCGREYGWCCDVRTYNPYHANICKECYEEPQARAVMDAYLAIFRATNKRLTVELQTIDITEELGLVTDSPGDDCLENPHGCQDCRPINKKDNQT